jgi:hypothetical protein
VRRTIRNWIRCYIGWRLPEGSPDLHLDRLPGEYRVYGPDVSQRQWHEDHGGGRGTVHCEAVLGKLSLWVHPSKSRAERRENFETLQRGTVRFFGEVWDPGQPMPATVTRTDALNVELTNLSECCYEMMEWNQFAYGCDPPLYGVRCPKCHKQYAARWPNGERT